MMKVGIPKEISSGEARVAATPETVQKMQNNGFEIFIETGAGTKSFISDQAYAQAGATIQPTSQALYQQADIILKVQPPLLSEIHLLNPKTILITPIIPTLHAELIAPLIKRGVTIFSLSLLPRIARAQAMDTLSSMSNIAGYKSVLLAANHLPKFFPMLTTAAGTILPAKMIVIGAGVAGLQAIATARRLGAVVIAFDTRPITEEQVKSLGAEFVSLATSPATAQDNQGYAKEQSAGFYTHEQDIINRYLKNTDVIITTALIPGKPAPLLITKKMVETMKPGSVIVDLAIEQGGNCAFSEAGKIVLKHDITIIGLLNLPSTLSAHASQLFAKNIWSFLNYLQPQLPPATYDLSDDIIKNCLLKE